MSFEDRLLAELKAEVAERAGREHARAPRRITGRRLLAAAAITGVGAAALVAVPVLSGSQSPAYAVTKNADGSITVTINEFRNPEGLEADLAQLGVRAEIAYHRSNLTSTINCPDARLSSPEPSPTVPAPKGNTGKKTGPPAKISQWLADFGDKTFKIYPQRIKPGDTVTIWVDENTAGPGMWVGSGPPPPCPGGTPTSRAPGN